MNIRAALNFNKGYFSINREERNLAAILYHLLLIEGNLEKFLIHIDCTFPIIENEMGIYFEYAFIRDLWKTIGDNNNFKRKFILDSLQLHNREALEKMDIQEFNNYFGASRTPSIKDIVSPSNWSVTAYADNFKDNTEFLNVCKFKWCFNAKPDIVIHTSHNTAICIEAKLESREGLYPSNPKENAIFNKRGLSSYKPKQKDIQKMIMEELLGIETKPLLITLNESKQPYAVTWIEVFTNLDISSCPSFIQEWLKIHEFK